MELCSIGVMWSVCALVKSMHQKKPMQVKYGRSQVAKTHQFYGGRGHFAWINYSPNSGKYNRATYSQHRIALHTFLQRYPDLKLSPPNPRPEPQILHPRLTIGALI